MSLMHPLLFLTLLIQLVPILSENCVGTSGATYLTCPANPGGGPTMLTCCDDFPYYGPETETFMFPGGHFDLIIEVLNLDANEKLIIKKFDCDGDCKWLELDSSVTLPFYVHIDSPRFAMSSNGDDIVVFFTIDREECDCHPCRRRYKNGDGSGEIDFQINGHCYRFFCEFLSGGEGIAYVSRFSLIMSPNLPVEKIHNDVTKFSLSSRAYLKFKKSGQQKTSMIEQLDAFSADDLSFQISSHTGYQLLNGHITDPYFYLGIVKKVYLSGGTVHGYKHNGLNYTFTNCDGNGNSYFAFDTRNLAGSEVVGSSRPWIGSASVSSVTLPDYFFCYLEEHQGGCGVRYLTSWVALGYPFKY